MNLSLAAIADRLIEKAGGFQRFLVAIARGPANRRLPMRCKRN